MGKVRNETRAVLRDFVYEDLGKDQLKQRFRRIERQTTGANPHNIEMATFEFTGRSTINEEVERDIKQVLAEVFPDHQLPGKFPEKWDGG
jgi:hypothetical protein